MQIPVPNFEARLGFYRHALGHALIWRTDTAAGLRMAECTSESALSSSKSVPNKSQSIALAARCRSARHRLPCRSSRQDDFAKRPIISQMTQGLARLAEGIDPLDDRLD